MCPATKELLFQHRNLRNSLDEYLVDLKPLQVSWELS